MPQIVGKIPEFTKDEETLEVNPAVPISTVPAEEEKETPAEPPTENKPAGETEPVAPSAQQVPSDEAGEQVRGLQIERAKLLKEISDLRGQRRELKEQELFKVESTIGELEGVNPEDAEVIEKVLRAKGYVTKEESQKMFYESVKQEELNKFLERYPEYKPENDPADVNWQTLQRELAYYKMPGDPHRTGEVLERAHKNVRPLQSISRPHVAVAKRQLEVASVGSGGTQHSSIGKTLPPHFREEFVRGGWTEEEIKSIEKSL